MTGHATVDMALHYFHSNEAGLKQTVAMIPDITGPVVEDNTIDVTQASEEVDFAKRLEGLDTEALKRLVEFAQQQIINAQQNGQAQARAD